MTKLKSIITLVLLLAMLSAFSEGTPPNNIPITGSWDVNLPGHFIATTPLEVGEVYTIKNNTVETIYIWLLDDHTPVSYFPLLAGGSQEFTSPGNGFDIYTSGSILIKNVSLRQENEDEDN